MSCRKKRARSSRKPRRRRAKCKMACVALSSSPSGEVERAHERRYIFYFVRRSGSARTRLFKTKTPSIVIYAAVSALLSDTEELRE